jgi:cob(I)alamin adenosyltransferase
MVTLNKIYTKTGDDGSTGLATGARVPKDHIRVEAYGTVDEANAVIGHVRLALKGSLDAATLDPMLARIQNELFDLGADLATPESDQPLGWEPLRITPAQVARLEADIDRLNADLEPLKSFVLPAGSPGSTHLHIARTVVRRAERVVTTLKQMPDERVSDEAYLYLNRLSDLLFVAARWANDRGRADVLWVPGGTR